MLRVLVVSGETATRNPIAFPLRWHPRRHSECTQDLLSGLEAAGTAHIGIGSCHVYREAFPLEVVGGYFFSKAAARTLISANSDHIQFSYTSRLHLLRTCFISAPGCVRGETDASQCLGERNMCSLTRLEKRANLQQQQHPTPPVSIPDCDSARACVSVCQCVREVHT